jgi:hypothetical protein
MNVVIEQDTPHKNKTKSLTEQIDSIKNTLYRKIDVCFMKYGLRGLKKIDESIADGLKYFIAEEEGEISSNTLGSSPSRQSVRKEDFNDDDPMTLAGEMDDSYETQPIDNGMNHSTSQVSENAQSQYTDDAFALAAEMEPAPTHDSESVTFENINTEVTKNDATNL